MFRQRSLRSVFVSCALSALAGCYYVYPTQLPPMHHGALAVAGQPIEIKTREVKTFLGDCSNSDVEKGRCEMHDGKLRSWIPITHTQFAYGGHNLTYAELRELTDPNWTKVIEQAQQLKGSCRVSIVPSTLALASAAAGLIPFLFSRSLSDNQEKYIYIGSAVGFVGFSALSYPVGGHACRKSNNSTGAAYDWDLDDWEGFPGSKQLTDDVLKLASDFNDRVGAPTPEPTEPADGQVQDTSTSGEHPSPEVESPAVPATSRVRDALVANADYATFVAAVDHARLWSAFDAPAYTIFAPTERAFAALKPEVRAAVMSTATMKVHDQLRNHVVHKKLSRAELAKLEVLRTEGPHSQRIKVKKTKLLVGGGEIGEPTDTGDGLIYPIDTFLQ